MRFELTQALDAIERRLTTDVALAQAVMDVGAVARFGAIDASGRATHLLRAGMVIDALVRHLGEGAVMVYPVAGRELLADQDLSSKERMVLGRWLDDGLVEILPTVADRALEVADLTSLPLLATEPYHQYVPRYPWLQQRPDRVLRIAPSSTEGQAAIIGPVPDQPASPDGPGATLLARQWACRQQDCPSFGARRLMNQPVPRIRSGVPSCPRHDEPLVTVGGRPPAAALAVLADDQVRVRFVVRPGTPVVVGRLPDDPDGGIMLGPWLTGEAARMVSRNHVRLELTTDGTLIVTDCSTNGTVVKVRSGPFTAAEPLRLTGGGAQVLGRFDTVELYEGVEVGPAVPAFTRAGGEVGSVLADAPTISFRPPD